MPFDCSQCRKHINFSGEQPSFCPYCGVSLDLVAAAAGSADKTTPFMPQVEHTIEYGASAATGQDGVPAAVGGFRLVRFLGAGGMGAVYEGVGVETGQKVAVKLLTSLAKTTAGSLDRFRQEGRLASQLNHPNCVFVHRADEEAGHPYIVMELMPGTTLRDVVQQRGPLPADEAVAKTLDVIDGLIEAHRLNILHRDVKPSNCFLMADGRVKIGDFGLSKSLSADANLTQSGSFLGTVLYAAPEQIRGEPLDFAADVYSVCATLHYLLTGEAPFQHENPTVVISRVITDPAPDIRTRRPDLPRVLQRIVMRGLERQPEKRYQSLEELRSALADLVSRPLNRGSVGARFAAWLIDLVVLMPLWIGLTVLESWLNVGDWPAWLVPKFLYFTATEYLYGCSVGKAVLRLRVRDAITGGRPPFVRILTRTVFFVLFTVGFAVAVDFMPDSAEYGGIGIVLYVIGGTVLLAPMNRGNSYRGLHELWSGTRVIQLPWPRSIRRIVPSTEWKPATEPTSAAQELPTSFGGFTPAALLERQGSTFRMQVADPSLRREVHLIIRPDGQQLIDSARKSLARPTRTRWLAGGAVDDWAWDAFLAPAGTPLSSLTTAGRKLGWTEAVAILEQVADELVEAIKDGSLPGPLTLNHIFVRPDGRVQILTPLGDQPVTDAEGLQILRTAAPVLLEGAARPADSPPRRIQAVLPLHATHVLNRLLGVGPPFPTVAAFRTALRELETRPTETTTPQRVLSLGFQAIFLALPLCYLIAVSGLFNVPTILDLRRAANHYAAATYRLRNDPAQVVKDVPAMNDYRRYWQVGQLVKETQRAIDTEIAALQPGYNIAERITVRLIQRAVPALVGLGPDLVEAAQQRIHEGNAAIAEHRNVPPDVAAMARADRQALANGYWLIAAVVATTWVVWSCVTRGGLSLALAGLALVRADGRRARWWQCGGRAVIVWGPSIALLCLCVAVKVFNPTALFLHNMLWWSAVVLLLFKAALGILRPGRGFHDRIAGVWVVPR